MDLKNTIWLKKERHRRKQQIQKIIDRIKTRVYFRVDNTKCWRPFYIRALNKVINSEFQFKELSA